MGNVLREVRQYIRHIGKEVKLLPFATQYDKLNNVTDMETITTIKHEEFLVNTDKLAFSLAEAITRCLVKDRKNVTRAIRDLKEGYTLTLLNKAKIEGHVEGVTFTIKTENGELKEQMIGDTYHYTTYATLKVLSGGISVGVFNALWAHGCYGNEFVMALTQDMVCNLKAKVDEYLPTMLVRRKIMKNNKLTIMV